MTLPHFSVVFTLERPASHKDILSKSTPRRLQAMTPDQPTVLCLLASSRPLISHIPHASPVSKQEIRWVHHHQYISLVWIICPNEPMLLHASYTSSLVSQTRPRFSHFTVLGQTRAHAGCHVRCELPPSPACFPTRSIRWAIQNICFYSHSPPVPVGYEGEDGAQRARVSLIFLGG